jgi:membrane protease YdiL (CAAX protease family)
MTHAAASAPRRRAEIWCVLVAAAVPTLVTWLYFVALAGQSPAVQQTAYGVGKALQFAFPLLWVLWWAKGTVPFLRRPRFACCPATRIGTVPGRPRGGGLAAGAAFGAVVFVAMLWGYHAWLGPAGLLVPAGKAIAARMAAFGLASPAGFAGMAIFYAVVHSLLEEYYWRWFLFGQMRRLMPAPSAVVLSSLAFTLHHVIVLAAYFGWRSPATAVFSLAVAVAGVVWAWIYHRSGSLLGPWLSHALADAALFTVAYSLLRARLGW